MNEIFDLPVNYKGKTLLFPSRLVHLGYTHQFLVNVYGTEVSFEPDEERSYRAVVNPDAADDDFDTGLLQAIAEAIENVLK